MSLLWGFGSEATGELSIHLEKAGSHLEINKDDLIELLRAIRDFWRVTGDWKDLPTIFEHDKT